MRNGGWRSTLQRADPLAVASAWPLVVGVVSLVLVYGLWALWLHRDEIVHPGWAAVGAIASVVACVLTAVVTRPELSPATPLGPAVVGILCTAAHVAFSAGVWGENERIQDDPGPFITGVLFAVFAVFRPALRIGVGVLCLVVLYAAVAMAQAPFLEVRTALPLYVFVVAAPLLGFPIAMIVYAESRRLAVGDFVRRVAASARKERRGLASGLADSVRQEQHDLLEAEAAPFLRRILEQDAVREADVDEARRIARTLRRDMVRVVEETWLQSRAAALFASASVHGSMSTATAMPPALRANVTALLTGMARLCGGSRLDVNLTAPQTGQGRAVFTVPLAVEGGRPHREARRALFPYLAGLRVLALGASVRVHVESLSVTVDFSVPGASFGPSAGRAVLDRSSVVGDAP